MSTVFGQAAALLTASAALAFIAGNLVLLLRSWFQRFPWGALLQDVSVADIQIVGAAAILPTLFVAGLWTTLAIRTITSPWKQRKLPKSESPSRASIAVVGILASILLTLSVPVLIKLRSGSDQFSGLHRSLTECFVAVAVLAALFSAVAALLLPKTAALGNDSARNLLFAFVTTLSLLPTAVGIVATSPFPPVLVCLHTQPPVSGVLIGTSDTNTYIGRLPNDRLDDPGAGRCRSFRPWIRLPCSSVPRS